MPGFFGRSSVLRTIDKHRRTGKLVSATLYTRPASAGSDTYTAVSYANCYVHPATETTGIGAGGHPDVRGTVTLYRAGEAAGPRVDDRLTVGSVTYLIISVSPRLNADEASGYAVYDLGVVGDGL